MVYYLMFTITCTDEMWSFLQPGSGSWVSRLFPTFFSLNNPSKFDSKYVVSTKITCEFRLLFCKLFNTFQIW